MKRGPIFSIVMPTYNAGARLQLAVASVIEQTFGDWELIVVDDGSTDDSVKGLICGDERIRVYILEQNSGSPVAPRNFGVSLANGRWLAFLDADDEWKSEKLTTVVAFAKTHSRSSECPSGLYYHDMELEGSRRGRLWSDLSTCRSGYVLDDLLIKNFIPTSSVVIPRMAWRPMDVRLRVSHDWDLWLDLARKFYVYYVPSALGTLTLHEGSVVTDIRRRRAESRMVVRRHRPHCRSLWKKTWATLYYYLVELYDII